MFVQEVTSSDLTLDSLNFTPSVGGRFTGVVQCDANGIWYQQCCEIAIFYTDFYADSKGRSLPDFARLFF